MKTLGNRLKEIRIENNLTQQEFATSLSISRPFVSRIESDKEMPSDSLMKLISATYNIRLEWIKTGNGQKEDNLKLVKFLADNNVLNLEELETFDYTKCMSIIFRILKNPRIKYNSTKYYRERILSILTIIEHLLTTIDVNNYEFEEIDSMTAYIEKKVYEVLEAYKKEGLDN